MIERIREVGESSVCTSIVVSAELRYGAMKKGSARLLAQREAVLSAIVTDNQREFERVEGLIVENWIRS